MRDTDRTETIILAVDDDVESLNLLAGILKTGGYRIRPTRQGSIALTSAQSDPPDVILLDVMMPGMSGYTVCERLKADERTRDIPVIFISALHETSDKVKGLALGGVDFITKPFQAEEVLARVSAHANLQKLTKQLKEQNARLHQEIAERQRAEETLEERDAELQAVLNAVPDMIFVLNREGRYLKVVSTSQELLYKPKEEMVGKTLDEIFAPEQADMFLQTIRKTIDSRRVLTIEYALIIQGQERWFEGRLAPMNSDLVVAIARDISEHKWAAKLLKNAHQNLERRVREELEKRCQQEQRMIQEAVTEAQKRLAAEIARETQPVLVEIAANVAEWLNAAASAESLSEQHCENACHRLQEFLERLTRILNR